MRRAAESGIAGITDIGRGVAELAQKLFGERVEPACGYCRFGRPTADGRMILCEKAGVVAPYYRCKKYHYAPLKRVPARQAVLPTYSKSDFEL